MFVESKKSICLICLALLTAIMGVAFAIFQSEILFSIMSVSFITMILLFLLWHQPVLSGVHRLRSGRSAYKLTKSINDVVARKLEKYSVEIVHTRIKISTAIREAMRNIHAFAESSENERGYVEKIIEKTKKINNDLFRYQDMGAFRNNLDALCNHIFIVGQKGLFIIEQIQSSEKYVTELMNEFNENSAHYTAGYPKKHLNNCVSELRNILDGQLAANHKFIDHDIDAIQKLTIAMKSRVSATKQELSFPLDSLSGLLTLSTGMTTVAVRLMQLSQMLENNLTILLKVCELSDLFQGKHQAFMTRSEKIKSKFYQALTKLRQDKNAEASNGRAALLELEAVKDLVNEPVFDSPKQ